MQTAILDRLLDIAHRHSGACDEIWLCANGYETSEALRQFVAPLKRFQEKCEQYGIRLSFQQGITLGHGIDPVVAENRPGLYPFANEDFMCDEKGTRLPGQLCPRSPNVQRFAYEYTKTVLETLNPDSYWLDDDLRVGVCKPQECFCDRCVAEFNRQNNTDYSREQLAGRLFGEEVIEPLRGKWAAFNAEAIAIYAAQSRKAADDLRSGCRLAIQTVWANQFYTADDYRRLLEALAGKERRPVGIRPGALHYTEAEPRGMTHKSMSVAREAARCRRYGFVESICYEQENYPRKVLHKTPEAILTESALALASGCDSLSEYYYDSNNHEPLEYYDDFSRELSMWRPYLETLAASSRRARLGGIARFLGSNAYGHISFNLDDEADEWLAEAGVPVTVEEAGPDAFLVTPKTVQCMAEGDFPRLFARTVLLPADAFDLLAREFPQELEKTAPDAMLARNTLEEAVRTARLIEVVGGCAVVPSCPISDEIAPELLQYGTVVASTVFGTKFAIVPPLEKFPTTYQRQALLDALAHLSHFLS